MTFNLQCRELKTEMNTECTQSAENEMDRKMKSSAHCAQHELQIEKNIWREEIKLTNKNITACTLHTNLWRSKENEKM